MGKWVSGSDLKLGLRWLRRQPVMAVTAVVALAVGIFLATTGFTVLEATLFGKLPLAGRRAVRAPPGLRRAGRAGLARPRPLPPAARAGDLVRAPGGDRRRRAQPDRRRRGGRAGARGAGHPGIAALRARIAACWAATLVAADGEPGAPPVVLLRESLWRRRFGADPAVLGRAARPRRRRADGGRGDAGPFRVPRLGRGLGAAGRAGPRRRGRRAPSRGRGVRHPAAGGDPGAGGGGGFGAVGPGGGRRRRAPRPRSGCRWCRTPSRRRVSS